jgi:ferrous iron transport protein A
MDALVSIHALGNLRPGQRGRIVGLDPAGLNPDQEERLLRMGFAEDARIEVRHEGPVGRDPMAVRVDGIIIALRRRDADAILVEVDPPR